MGSDHRIRLIVNADDFGISPSANRAILRAHREGILTTTSLMVNGEAAEEAARQGHQHPKLGIGLHLTLVKGMSTLKPVELPGLVNARSEFDESPVRAGMRYFFLRRLHTGLHQEINAQFTAFRRTRLPLDHVNGHLHFHLHPTVFSILSRNCQTWGIRHMRLTRDPLLPNLAISRGFYFYRISHALIFNRLAHSAAPVLARASIRHTDQVFGLLENDRVTERYLLELIDRLTPGTHEVYTHPDEDAHAHELEALCSPKVRARIEARGIELIRYSDL